MHLLSPFDPLVILRKRLELFFGYTHLFEAYVPKEKKRVFGYFGLPVLVDDEIVAVIDLKADRTAGTMLIRQWTWVGTGNDHAHRPRIEDALARFEEFQLNRTPSTTCIAGVSRTAYVPATPHPFD
ncbi:crosslink repair DNA glycosylase YcaQ family protein [Actinoplanes sp. NPDC051411]|uniref:DNA glycosylase AlkZ-like family protein n=1 Tax=Actinoplanes sp. NPDC051411 TaxID=3155522 RepID=UPI003433D549